MEIITRQEILARQKALCERMQLSGIDVLISGSSAQITTRGTLRYLINYYLPVFEEYLVISADGRSLFFAHDASGAAYAEKYGVVNDIRIIPGDEYNNDPGRCVAQAVRAMNPRKIALAGKADWSAGFYISLMSYLKDIPIEDFSWQLAAMRMIKSPAEILLDEAAAKLNDDTFLYYLQSVKDGGSELEAIDAATLFAKQHGAEDIYWMSDSGVIPSLSYLMDAYQHKHLWQRGDYHYIILEHAAAGGHFGEVTELISFGEPKPEYTRAFSAICEAQAAAFEMICPGNMVGQVADAANNVLADMGYVPECSKTSRVSAIGHGQGLDAWEYPRVAHGDATVIQAGMRLNLHPSITLQDKAKITFCDCYIATLDGARRLSSLPHKIFTV